MFYKATTLLAASLPLIQAGPSFVPGFSITWSDDFTGSAGSLPSASNWIIDTGTSYPGGPAQWGTGEVQTYTNNPQNVKLTGNGQLQITPIRDSNGRWTSGRIETTRTDFQAKAGGKMRISARISLPDVTGAAAAGYWPAFWTLGNNFRGNYWNWPSVGEFDIMENVNGINRGWGVLHCGTNPGGVCNEANGIGSNGACPNSNCQGNYHVYSFEVNRAVSPERLTWYIDNNAFHSVTKDQLGSTWEQTVHKGHFILLNVAMGGGFPNGVAGSSTPTQQTVSGKFMLVDWVAVYNSN